MTKDHYDTLLNNPQALYLLYQMFEHHSDNLPEFIDRGDEAKILAGLGYATQKGKGKHFHKQPLALSTAGRIFAEDYCSAIFESIKKIPEINRESLMSCCMNHRDREYAWQDTEIIHEELRYLPPLGETRRQKAIEMIVRKYRRIQEPGLVFEIEIHFVCKRCRKTTIFTQILQISEDLYDPLKFRSQCQHCNLILHCDSYFQRFYMDDIS